MQDKRARAKEYIKFNERCFLRLLGDMRSYNYLVVITQDFDRIQYRLRAIDFDQQSYEGDARVYKPECLPENDVLTKMTRDVLPAESVDQYVKEERSLRAKRAASESQRLHDLAGLHEGGSHLRGGQNRRAQRRAVQPDWGYSLQEGPQHGRSLAGSIGLCPPQLQNGKPVHTVTLSEPPTARFA
jgi:hypothetical protein